MYKIALLGFLALVQGVKLNQMMVEDSVVEAPAETTTTVTTTTVTTEDVEAAESAVATASSEDDGVEITIDAPEENLGGIMVDAD